VFIAGAIPTDCQFLLRTTMPKNKLTIHIAKHGPTGAEVPMVVKSVDANNVITDYKEFLENRKGFSLRMLQNRWDLCRDDVIEMLDKYKVPAHVNHSDIKALPQGGSPIDVAIFFEEYIYALEKKEKLKHSKLKSRKLQLLRDH
jgi:hypothetical protein